MVTYKLVGLMVPRGSSDIRELDVSNYLKDIHDAQPGDLVELDDGSVFSIVEIEIAPEPLPKCFITLRKIKRMN